jgi:uncharacterized protein (UPF0254 family)
MHCLKNAVVLIALFFLPVIAGTQSLQPAPPPAPKGMMMLTMFLKHDQSKDSR